MSTDISMDIIDALHYLHQTHYVRQAGYPSSVGAEFAEVNGIFATRDGRYIMLEAGPPCQKLLHGYLNFFDCATTSNRSPARSPGRTRRIRHSPGHRRSGSSR
jgi:hypothetical protein